MHGAYIQLYFGINEKKILNFASTPTFLKFMYQKLDLLFITWEDNQDLNCASFYYYLEKKMYIVFHFRDQTNYAWVNYT